MDHLHVDQVNMFVVVCVIMLKFCNDLMMLRFCNSICGACHIPCLRNMKLKTIKLLCF
jgi:hypothetical protein